jgi:hypothetical protein
MTALSTRYVGLLLALLLPVFFAVWIYSYGGFRSDDCADPAALLETGWMEGLERTDQPDGKPRPWLLQGVYGSVAKERREISRLQLQILRSFELERLYERPVRLLPKGRDFVVSTGTLEWIGSQGDEFPIHKVFEEAPGISRLGAYMFLYDFRPMADPSLGLLSATLKRVATGRYPLTLLTISVTFSSQHREAAERLAEERLIAAWEYYRSVCSR